MITPTIQCYAKLERIRNLNGKIPRYDCTAFAGYYPPLDALKNNKGELFFYLQCSTSNGNRKDSNTTPEMYLQGKDSINLTGLYHYWEDGRLSGFCSGYPSKKERLGTKKPINNPFYKSNKDDCFLFIINQDIGTITPSSIEMLVLKDARVLVDAYRKQLKLGGFVEVLRQLREQAKPLML